MGLCEVVTIIFIVLKLLGAITWSWWWVFAPEIFALVVAVVLSVYGASLTKRAKKETQDFIRKNR